MTSCGSIFLCLNKNAISLVAHTADLYSPAIESGFTSYTLYEDSDLLNTPLDCTRCHQPGGTATEKMLLMQQLQAPWTHFFTGFSESGQMLINNYYAAHGEDEAYAGIPGKMIRRSDAESLQFFVENNGFVDQAVEFPSQTIEREVLASGSGQPFVNDPPGESTTWNDLRAAMRGVLPGVQLAYHDAQVADVTRLQEMSEDYSAFASGASNFLPDLSEIFLEAALPDLGFRPQPGATGEEILVQACGRCHNDAVRPELSRSRFNAMRLSEMSRGQKDVAISRLLLPENSSSSMPPARSVELSEEERARAIDALKR